MYIFADKNNFLIQNFNEKKIVINWRLNANICMYI